MKLSLKFLVFSAYLAFALAGTLLVFAQTLPPRRPPFHTFSAAFSAVARKTAAAAMETKKREWAEANRAAEAATAAREVKRKVEAHRIDVSRVVVALMLRDPDSAKFGLVFGGRHNAACGYVNARNGFGGMSGMQMFVHLEGGMPVIGDKAILRWNSHCAGLTVATR